MGILDRLFGRREEQPGRYADASLSGGQQLSEADEAALQRYRYMVRTAPPEAIEQAHEEAFSKLTPSQRAQVLRELAAVTPPNERPASDRDDPKTLARLATRAELREPGTVERTMLGAGPGMGMGGMMMGSILTSFMAGFLGSMVANQFFSAMVDVDFSQTGWSDAAGPTIVDGADVGFADSGADPGGDFADFGGDI